MTLIRCYFDPLAPNLFFATFWNFGSNFWKVIFFLTATCKKYVLSAKLYKYRPLLASGLLFKQFSYCLSSWEMFERNFTGKNFFRFFAQNFLRILSRNSWKYHSISHKKPWFSWGTFCFLWHIFIATRTSWETDDSLDNKVQNKNPPIVAEGKIFLERTTRSKWNAASTTVCVC